MSRSATSDSVKRPSKLSAPSLDDLTKILALVVAVIGVAKYFYDKAETAQTDRRARAIGYIERYADPEILASRQSLHDFWTGQPELVAVFREESLSERNYLMMLKASVFRQNADTEIHRPLLLLDNFYSQISYCRSAALCDLDVLDAFFCSVAKKDAVAYGPFFDRLRERSGDQSLGKTLISYARVCQD